MIRVGLIGAGTMGSYHARVVASSERAILSAVIDQRPTVGQAVAQRFGSVWQPSIDSFEGLDAVIVAASTEAHYELAVAALGSGTPLLVEKPVADSLMRTREIVELAERNGIPIVCGLLERFNPAIQTAKLLVDSPVHVTSTRHSPYAPRIRTGVAWDLLIHDVDLAIGIFGEAPTTTTGALGNFHPDSDALAEDVATAILTFGHGQVAQLSASRIGQRKVRTMTVHEIDRLIEIDLLRRDVTVYRHVFGDAAEPDGRGYRQQTTIEIPEITVSREPLAAQFDHFLDLIDGVTDADAERKMILPAHAAIASLLSSARRQAR